MIVVSLFFHYNILTQLDESFFLSAQIEATVIFDEPNALEPLPRLFFSCTIMNIYFTDTSVGNFVLEL